MNIPCKQCGAGQACAYGCLCYDCAFPEGGPSEPTEEEVERIVAEQMANLPEWWAHDAELQRQRRPRWIVPVVRDPRRCTRMARKGGQR